MGKTFSQDNLNRDFKGHTRPTLKGFGHRNNDQQKLNAAARRGDIKAIVNDDLIEDSEDPSVDQDNLNGPG
jgi:hypothetical protein